MLWFLLKLRQPYRFPQKKIFVRYSQWCAKRARKHADASAAVYSYSMGADAAAYASFLASTTPARSAPRAACLSAAAARSTATAARAASMSEYFASRSKSVRTSYASAVNSDYTAAEAVRVSCLGYANDAACEYSKAGAAGAAAYGTERRLQALYLRMVIKNPFVGNDLRGA